MIVVDTSILSTFARIQRIELLFAVAETDSHYNYARQQRGGHDSTDC